MGNRERDYLLRKIIQSIVWSIPWDNNEHYLLHSRDLFYLLPDQNFFLLHEK
jgi:hypothetical protein